MDDLFSTISTVGSVLGLLVVVAMVLAYKYRHLQDMMVYHPNTPDGSTEHCLEPHEFGMTHYEAVHIATSDGVTIRGYFVHPHNPLETMPAFTLVYFHGNAGNVGHRLPIARLLIQHLKCSVLMMDYRGYGLSDPVPPTEEGLKLDAQATIDYLLTNTKIQKDRIFVLGTSLGGAVAVDLASRPAYAKVLAGVVLENTFTSISDMADALFIPMLQRGFPRGHRVLIPFLQHLIKPIVLFVGWWSIDSIRKVSCPLLFLSGCKDELVPPSHVKQLYDVAHQYKQSDFVHLVEFPTGKHNDLFMAKGYTQSIDQFIKDVLRRKQVEII